MTPRLTRLESRLVPSSYTELISTTIAGTPPVSAGGLLGGNDNRLRRSMSADGRYTVFTTPAPNLLPGLVNDDLLSGVYLHDRIANSTTLVSRAINSSGLVNVGGYYPEISADGRFVCFQSGAANIVSGFVPSIQGNSHVYLFDRLTGVSVLVDHLPGSNTMAAGSSIPDAILSDDGNFVAYLSPATDLIANFVPGSTTSTFENLYLYDRTAGTNTLVSRFASNPNKGTNASTHSPVLSSDGQYLAFVSGSGALVSGFTGANGNVFLYDRIANAVELITRPAGATGNVGSGMAGNVGAMTPDGRHIAFSSGASNLVNGFVDANGFQSDLYRFDRQTGQTYLISHQAGSPSAGSTGVSRGVRVSADGQSWVLASNGADLDATVTDTNGKVDLFSYDPTSGNVSLVTKSALIPAQASDGESLLGGLDMTPDGRYVIFGSSAKDLIAGLVLTESPYNQNVWIHDRVMGSMRLITHPAGAPTTSSGSYGLGGRAISDDGGWVALQANGSSMVPGVIASRDVFLWNNATDSISLVSLRQGPPGLSGGGVEERASADGRYIVYTSFTPAVVAGQIDTNLASDIFLYDRSSKTTVLVSHAFGSNVTTGKGASSFPVISGDGRFVAYYSHASNLVAGFTDNNNYIEPDGLVRFGTDIFLYDRVTGINTLVTHRFDSATAGADRTSGLAFYWDVDVVLSVSHDGRFVAFVSQASNLIANFVDGNSYDSQGGWPGSDMYLFDRLSGDNVLVNHIPGSATTGTSYHTLYPRISPDNSVVAHGDGGLTFYDIGTGVNTIVSGPNRTATFSANGRYMVFFTSAPNFVPGVVDNNNFEDIYLYDRLTGTFTLVSHAVGAPMQAGNKSSAGAAISADGRFVSFLSRATDLVPGFVDNNVADVNSPNDAFLFDRETSSITLVSHSITSPSAGGNKGAHSVAISRDGRFVGFNSSATNLIPINGPTNVGYSVNQVYLFDQRTGATTLVSHSREGPNFLGNGTTNTIPIISSDGSVVTFESVAFNLIANDWYGAYDVFAYVTPPPQVTSLQINDGSMQRSVVKSITVSFDEPIFISDPAAAFTLTRVGSAGSVQCSVVSLNSPNGIVTLTFSGPLTQFGSLVDGNYSLTIDASQTKNIAALDGNGDGVAGDNWVSPAGSIFRLFGDMNGDRAVAANDFIALRLAFAGSSAIFDFDNDGYVSASDLIQFRLRFGGSI